QGDLPLFGPDEAEDGLEEGGLPHTVGPQDRGDLPGRSFEANPPQDGEIPVVAGVEAAHLKHRPSLPPMTGPGLGSAGPRPPPGPGRLRSPPGPAGPSPGHRRRSEEHTTELQSR